ncbi:MAG TPA: ribonuclease H-like domain-containing protein [Ignavibacteriaceae bacterium]|nr:ribonuclease H-like domain-containing protein [Ignavibacteriaceae bacterium]
MTQQNKPRQIVFDIETYGCKLTDLAESQQEYLLREAEKEKDEQLKAQKVLDAERFLSLYPLTARVVAIGIYDVNKEKSYVYFESETEEEWSVEEKNVFYKGLSEEEMIKSFWRIIEVSDQVITFNGRNFDIPFMMIRSAMLGIKPSKNLMGYRYDTKQHVDLLEQLSFYGVTKRFNLDFYCHSFGIKSPKTKEVSGMEVKNLYEAGKIKEIAIYCGDDIYATYRLFKIWNDFLNF